MQPSNSSVFRSVVFPLLILVFLLQNSARADKVDRLVSQMRSAGDYKIRLSAALNLAKIGDTRPKVINAFIAALKDGNRTVRGVAAASLGKLVDGRTSASLKRRAISALKDRVRRDSNSFVKRQATRALKKLEAGGGSGGGRGGVYVDVGRMSSKKGAGGEKSRLAMRKAIITTFRRKARTWMTSWPGGRSPSRRQLKAKNMAAFYVDGTLTTLKEQPRGSSTVVTCKVSLLLASYPSKSMFAFPSGGAQVTTSSSARQIRLAKEDCIAAVTEALVGSKIIPILKIKAGAR